MKSVSGIAMSNTRRMVAAKNTHTQVCADRQQEKCEVGGNQTEGYGSWRYHNGDVYVGNWKDNQQHGFGQYTYRDGGVFDGEFFYGKKHNRGTYTYRDGSVFQGWFFYGKEHGPGEFIDTDNNILEEAFYLVNDMENFCILPKMAMNLIVIGTVVSQTRNKI